MPRAPADVEGHELKPWRELRAGQKMARAGRGLLSIGIIGFGVGLAVTVVYTVGSELFRSNSPSKLYGQAFDLVRADPDVADILIAPLRCHGDTVTMGGRSNKRSRGRPLTQIDDDDRMTIRFYVTGLTEAERDASWLQRARRFAHELIYAPSSPSQVVVAAPDPSPAAPATEPAASYLSSLYAWFASFVAGIMPDSLRQTSHRRKSRAAASVMPVARPIRPTRGSVTTAEVTCRLQRNTSGDYVFKTIAVDFPENKPGAYRVSVVSRDQQARPPTGLAKLWKGWS